MPRKKSSRKGLPASQGFENSPFKNLKGLPVSGNQPSSTMASGKDCETGPDPCPDNDDQHAFADEMDFLGVKRLPGQREKALEPEPQVAGQPFETPGQSRHELDTAIFLEAVSDITTMFKDEEPDSAPGRQSAARRMRQVERGMLKPEAVLDLHGLTLEEATSKVGYFLQNAAHHNLGTLLIITGKGLHSNDGPVLKEAVEKLLGQAGNTVIEWGVAPRRYGGKGALLVFLRRNNLE